ncbi:MAG TPA: hypothetical protein VFK07_02195 [Candidatus Paceibacterota bacterium]|nr:hypothetical protein [Candidatus Paceibacterota bacterium]
MEGVVVFAFGVPATLRSNRTLAAIAEREAKSFRAPVFTQLDIQLEDKSVPVTYCQEIPGEPPPTLRIAREAIRWAIDNKISVLHVAAARPHIWRAVRDLVYARRKAGADILIVFCKGVLDRPSGGWFMPESTHPRVRSAWKWYSRDLILRLMPMFIYKKVAG